MKIIMVVKIDYQNKEVVHTVMAISSEYAFCVALREHIAANMFNVTEWAKLATEYTNRTTANCYEPEKCRPGACAFCNKFQRYPFADEVLEYLRNSKEYIFFAHDGKEFIRLYL